MKIYNYSPINFEYISTQNADLDPEETKQQGKNVYLIPAYATTVKPPVAQEDKARVWIENQWEYVADYRKNYYQVSDALEVLDITEIGDIEGILVSKELGELIKENPDNYVIDNNEVREKTEAEKEAEEAERISHLKMTKRVCALMLQQLGVSYTTLKEAIATSEQAQLEWDLCVELERNNPLINIVGATFGLSSAQIDQMFKYANGEVETLEVE